MSRVIYGFITLVHYVAVVHNLITIHLVCVYELFCSPRSVLGCCVAVGRKPTPRRNSDRRHVRVDGRVRHVHTRHGATESTGLELGRMCDNNNDEDDDDDDNRSVTTAPEQVPLNLATERVLARHAYAVTHVGYCFHTESIDSFSSISTVFEQLAATADNRQTVVVGGLIFRANPSLHDRELQVIYFIFIFSDFPFFFLRFPAGSRYFIISIPGSRIKCLPRAFSIGGSSSVNLT